MDRVFVGCRLKAEAGRWQSEKASSWNTCAIRVESALGLDFVPRVHLTVKMTEIHDDKDSGEKVSPAQHLEAVQLEEGKDGRPVFGIDEKHQRKIMCVCLFFPTELTDWVSFL